MISLPSALDPAWLQKAVESLKFWRDGTGIEMSHLQFQGVPEFISQTPVLFYALMEIEDTRLRPVKHAMVNRLQPGVTVPFHADKDPQEYERWHLPLVTNEGSKFCYAGEDEFHMLPGYWWGPVEYWRSHAVANLGKAERTHLVVDLGQAS